MSFFGSRDRPCGSRNVTERWLYVALLAAVSAGCATVESRIPVLVEDPPAPINRPINFGAPDIGTSLGYTTGVLRILKVEDKDIDVIDGWKRNEKLAAGIFLIKNFANRGDLDKIWPLDLGKQVSFDEESSGVQFHHRILVQDQEMVKTIAGNFETMVLLDQISGGRAGVSQINVMAKYWYAPALHATVRRQISQRGGNPYWGDDFDLVNVIPPGIVGPRLTVGGPHCGQPPLPSSVVSAGVDRTVSLKFLVDASGRATAGEIVTSSGDDDLDRVTLEKFGKCPFQPATFRGVPISFEKIVQYTTHLDQAGFAQNLRGGDKVLSATELAVVQPYDMRARGNAAVGKFDSAISDWTTAIKAAPEYAPLYDLRGTAYGTEGKYDLALADFETASRLHPTLYSLTGQATMYMYLGKSDFAIASATAATIIVPSQDEPYFIRGLSYYLSGEWQQAANDFIYAWNRDRQNEGYLLWYDIARTHGSSEDQQEIARLVGDGPWAPRWQLLRAVIVRQLSYDEALARGQDRKIEGQTCILPFYLGEAALAHGDRQTGLKLLREARHDCTDGGDDAMLLFMAGAELTKYGG